MSKKFKKDEMPEPGALVSVPDRICFPGRRDPYEWENAVVVRSGYSKTTGVPAVRVKVWNHMTRTSYEKNYAIERIEKYTHYERSVACLEFLKWADAEKGVLQ